MSEAARYAQTTPGGISAATSPDRLGRGRITLCRREGDRLVPEGEAEVYSPFRVAVPHPRRLVVDPDGDAFVLVAADVDCRDLRAGLRDGGA